MKRLKKIIVPTDLSKNSRRALSYGCWLAGEENAALIVFHAANDLYALSRYGEELVYPPTPDQIWPLDRLLAEATLDLNRFLEPHFNDLKKASFVAKRVVFGPVADRIAEIAQEENADLVIMAPRRRRGLRHLLFGGVTDRVARLCPCPVLSITEPTRTTPQRGRYIPNFAAWLRSRSATAPAG